MYINMLTRIKNAILAGKKRVKAPYAKFDLEVAEALVKSGYVAGVEKKGRSIKKIIDIDLKFDGETSAIRNIRIMSKPSQRVYKGYRDIYSSKQGYGNYFLTTPKGVMTEREAKRNKVGGEVLFEIW